MTMPCDPAKLAKLNMMMDEFLESRRLHPELDEDEMTRIFAIH
jgi:hypothetical protein